MAAIITLRQEVLTGTKQLATSLTVHSWCFHQDSDKAIRYQLLDGRQGIIPLQNIAGICELKEN